jgi:hypothetical protein
MRRQALERLAKLEHSNLAWTARRARRWVAPGDVFGACHNHKGRDHDDLLQSRADGRER